MRTQYLVLPTEKRKNRRQLSNVFERTWRIARRRGVSLVGNNYDQARRKSLYRTRNWTERVGIHEKS